MTLTDRFAEAQGEIAEWRRDFHAHPELLYEVHRTAGLVAERLRAFGCDEVVEGVGRTGVVGVIRGKREGRAIGLRADMDALPIAEATDLPWRSTTPGRMHACGHDGHTAMLLGAARHLAETRDFAGTAVAIFQPAEEGGAGGRAMVEDGLMERFAVAEVYAMHNMPGLPEGAFRTRPGPLMAAADFFAIEIEGRGGHAAKPHQCIDPIRIGSHLHAALQGIVSRDVDPVASAVVSVTQFHAGEADNVIPQTAVLRGTVRTLDEGVRDDVEARMRRLVETTAEAFGASARLDYRRLYPVTINHPAETAFATSVAADVSGEGRVEADGPANLGGEDFSFMLQARPGAMIFLGQGDTAGLHHPAYDFNDAVIPVGCAFWTRLVEKALAP